MIDGELIIESAPGNGTRIAARASVNHAPTNKPNQPLNAEAEITLG
jgi:hypothetical protein